MVKKTTGFTFDVIKDGVTIFKDQTFVGVPDGVDLTDRNVYVKALKVWNNITSQDKFKWGNDFDYLYVKNMGLLIKRKELLQKEAGVEILKGVRYDADGKLMFYDPKEERESYF